MLQEGDRDLITAIAIADENYPAPLRELPDPPRALFVRGSLEALERARTHALAVVGSRRMTPYGIRVVREIVQPLAAYFTIVSGLALGTDGAAHTAALAAHGTTIAVVGSGVDEKNLYPQTHVELARAIIAAGGCIISEYPPGTSAQPYYFPVRNRILAGLSRGVLIVEAAVNSGTLITARCALDYNRDVFTVPGSIFSETSRGTNELLKHGAHIVTSAADVFDSFGIDATGLTAVGTSPQQKLLLPPDEFELLSALCSEPISMDALATKLGWGLVKVSQVLMRLELGERAKKIPGQGYVV